MAEGLVIVVSILLAFGVDAWWDWRQEAERREARLKAIRRDIAVLDFEIERVSSVFGLARSAVEELLQLGPGTPGSTAPGAPEPRNVRRNRSTTAAAPPPFLGTEAFRSDQRPCNRARWGDTRMAPLHFGDTGPNFAGPVLLGGPRE